MTLTLTGERPVLQMLDSDASFSVHEHDGSPRLTVAGTRPASAIAAAITGDELPGRTVRERPIASSQTNRSFVINNTWIVKLVTHWGSAERAALLAEALNAADVPCVPRHYGHVRWHHPSYGTATVALVDEFIPDSVDGWSWAADEVNEALNRTVHDFERTDTDPGWPAALGAVTAQVHAALAAAEFPKPSKQPQETLAEIANDVTQLLSARSDPAAVRLRNRLPILLAETSRNAELLSTLPRFVTHGDLHTGQFVRDSRGRYFLLDFDGDPQWAPGTGLRRLPLETDLAHMLVSIGLEASLAQRRRGEVSAEAWAWVGRAREQFLGAYLAELGDLAPHLTICEEVLPALCARRYLFELRYAARYDPDWEYASDGALWWEYPADDAAPIREEETPWTPPAF